MIKEWRYNYCSFGRCIRFHLYVRLPKGASGVSLEIGGLGFFFRPKLMNLSQLMCTSLPVWIPFFFSTKTHELIAITVHIIACMDHFVIGEPTSMIHSVTAM